MAKKKKLSPPPVRSKAPPRIARSPSIRPSLRAHPRLVHGFLVRLAKRSTVTSGGTNTGFTGKASGKVQTELPSDTKHEGPADDATFH
jgi:hypothetical protein